MPKYWNTELHSCQYCPPQEYFDVNEGSCKKCDEGYELKYIEKIQQHQCVFIPLKCVPPMHYSAEFHACQLCPKETIYDESLSKCVQCPEDRPIASENDRMCIGCLNEGEYYDRELQKCTKCSEVTGSEMTYYNSTYKQCIPKCLGESEYSPEDKACKCPEYRPFYTGTQCVSCYLPKYWDVLTQSCQFCPTNKYFNLENQACEYCQSGYKLSGQTYTCEKSTEILKNCVFPYYYNFETSQC